MAAAASDGVPEAVATDVRARDRARLALQQAEGLFAGADLLHRPRLTPEPLRTPEIAGTPLNPEAEDIISHETEFSG